MAYFDRPTTPAEQSRTLRELVNSLVPEATPVYVDVAPCEGEPADECFFLVQAQVEKIGGAAVVGWSLWEMPTLFIEAEFHCVWRQPNDVLVDITPKQSYSARILFLPDPSRSFNGRQVNNVRRLLTQRSELKSYLATFDELYEFKNRGERAEQFGQVHLSGVDADEYEDILQRQAEARLALAPSIPQVGVYHPCPCGSGRKVKWCHRHYASGS